MTFDQKLREKIDNKEIFKITLSRPRQKSSELRNVFVRPVRISDQLMWQATYRYKTKDQTKNYDGNELAVEVSTLVENTFFNADLFLENEKWSLLQSKKGKQTLLNKKEKTNIKIDSNDKEKARLIPENSPYLKELGLASTNHKIYAHAQDKYKQINKYIEHINALVNDQERITTVVDMGSGKGYLTFALYNHLVKTHHNLQVKGVELRPDLNQKCNTIAQRLSLLGLSFEEGSIDTYDIGKSDMVIALHACDIATDMAIAKGVEANAKYIIVAPCCHKQIRKAMTDTSSTLNPIIRFGIQKERQAEMITDTIRALMLESLGYSVKVFEFIASEHTGKNVMITAKYTGNRRKEARSEIDALKSEFGINEHYLERLVSLTNTY